MIRTHEINSFYCVGKSFMGIQNLMACLRRDCQNVNAIQLEAWPLGIARGVLRPFWHPTDQIRPPRQRNPLGKHKKFSSGAASPNHEYKCIFSGWEKEPPHSPPTIPGCLSQISGSIAERRRHTKKKHKEARGYQKKHLATKNEDRAITLTQRFHRT